MSVAHVGAVFEIAPHFGNLGSRSALSLMAIGLLRACCAQALRFGIDFGELACPLGSLGGLSDTLILTRGASAFASRCLNAQILSGILQFDLNVVSLEDFDDGASNVVDVGGDD